jgi:hypothetical protein
MNVGRSDARLEGCPDWAHLSALRDHGEVADAEWHAALEHRRVCVVCLRVAREADPLLMLQDLPPLDFPVEAVADLQARVRGARRELAGRAARRDSRGAWRAAAAVLLVLPLAAAWWLSNSAGPQQPVRSRAEASDVALSQLDDLLDRMPIVSDELATGGRPRSASGGLAKELTADAVQMQLSSARYDVVWLVGEEIDL